MIEPNNVYIVYQLNRLIEHYNLCIIDKLHRFNPKMCALFIDRACQFNPTICALFIGKKQSDQTQHFIALFVGKNKRFNPTTFVEFMDKTNNSNLKFVRCSPTKHCDYNRTIFALFKRVCLTQQFVHCLWAKQNKSD